MQKKQKVAGQSAKTGGGNSKATGKITHLFAGADPENWVGKGGGNDVMESDSEPIMGVWGQGPQ